MVSWLRGGLPLAVLIAALVLGRPAQAQVGSERYASFVIDAGSGDILEAASADEPRYPASLTKMMTIYMLFEALRDRRVTLDQPVPVSPHAASMSPSKLGLVPGTYITVEQALLGLVTKSANDAAAALGELLGGDEERFAQMMTMRARALGMSRTTFRNASGWPDPDQVTTARDLALLARHLIQDYPAEYRYFSVPYFTFHGRYIPNHDRMLQTYPGADGLKTGYIDASGCNLVTSAVRGNVRLIGVVMGAINGGRTRHSHGGAAGRRVRADGRSRQPRAVAPAAGALRGERRRRDAAAIHPTEPAGPPGGCPGLGPGADAAAGRAPLRGAAGPGRDPAASL